MSYPRWRLSGYEDERRRPCGYDSYRYESYKPLNNRSPPRGHSNSRDSEQKRDMEFGRRDPRDAKDVRPPPRSPRSSRRDAEPPKNLQIDTRVADGSRRNSPSSHSSTSAFTAPPTEPAADRLGRLNSQLGSATTPTVPKAQDPKVQDVFEAVYKWNETLQERLLLTLRKNQLLHEDQRRQNEVTKIANKVDDYAPFSEFQRRFEESGKAESESVSKHLASLDLQYLEDLERVVATISSHSSTSSQAAAQSVSLSALETQFTEFQKQNSEQQKQISEAQAQIQVLLNDREKTTKSFDALDKDFRDLKSDYSTLQSENSELKQRVADLQSANLQSADLQSTKSTKDDLDQLSQTLHSFMTRVDNIENKVDTLIEDLDMKTYNEILDTWIGHDFKNMVISNKKTIVALRQELQSFQESTTTQLDAHNVLVQETQKSLETLKSSEPAPPQASTQAPEGTGELQRALQAVVEEKLNAFNEVIQKIVADSGDACADMVDEVRTRVDNIEATINALAKRIEASPKVSSTESDVVTRVSFLEESAKKYNTETQLLGKRVESLEGQRLGPRIDSVDIGLANLEKNVQNFQETSGGRDAAGSEDLINSLKSELEDARGRFDALEVDVRTLNSQWANLSTKQLAEIILLQLDPYGQQHNARIAIVEKDLKQLKSKLSIVEENLTASLNENKKLAEFAKFSPPDGKRRASPESSAEEPTKKRKLGPNGQPQVPGLRSSSLNL
ncbi:hypothetical protein F5Y06DRAFT_200687 [Hypoxylon sp. FL0890]|nr:hypothetical protein F5Y06DRAFT_200687 [Hypoxylon sp. FL0890]